MLLMKKDDIVADINIAYGNIIGVNKVFRADLLPVGVAPEGLNEWWKNNAIPTDRDSIRLGLACIGVDSQEELKVIGRGLSLLNQYWIKEAEEEITWQEVNYWENRFSEEVGAALFNHKPVFSPLNEIGRSPDNGINGALKKRWIVLDGEYYMQKSGTGLNKEEVFNEILASDLMTKADIRNAGYSFYLDNGEVSCISRCFTDENTEMVPLMQIIESVPGREYPAMSELEHLYSVLEFYQVPDYRKYLNDVLCMDYILAGTDRHYNNLALLFDTRSQTFSFSPVYDSGNCLWNGTATRFINVLDDGLMARPVCNKNTFGTWEKQKTYITDYILLKYEDLIEGLKAYVEMTLKYSEMSRDRIGLIANGVLLRAHSLQKYLLSKNVVIEKSCLIPESALQKNMWQGKGLRECDKKSR